MSGQTDRRLAELGVTLPTPTAPQANYVPFVRSGNQLFISGQLPMDAEGLTCKGKVGAEVSIEEASKAARLCAINILAQAKVALGDLDKVVRIVKLVGFINSVPEFGDQSKVMNGASDFLVEVLGDRGRHARSSVSAGALPLGAAVEVEAVIEIAP
jgi:enamine deaminase RidA (YjgF/YER057c/UK114 family)